MRDFLIKAIIGGIVAFIGIGGGIYVGTKLSGSSIKSGEPTQLRNTSLLSINDTFPDYTLISNESESITTVSQFASEGPTLLIFVSSNCSACKNMAVYWRKRVLPELREDIQIALIYNENELAGYYGGDDGESLMTSPDLLDFPGAQVFGAKRSVQIAEDGIFSTPTIVGLNPERKVLFISTGFSPDLLAPALNSFI